MSRSLEALDGHVGLSAGPVRVDCRSPIRLEVDGAGVMAGVLLSSPQAVELACELLERALPRTFTIVELLEALRRIAP